MQFAITDLTANINISSVVRRDTSTDQFAATSHSIIAGTPLPLPLGGIIIPHRIILKHISGDPILVSLNNGGAYRLQLTLPNDFIVLRLNPLSLPNIVLSVPVGTANLISIVES
jgi:hypothetical protein